MQVKKEEIESGILSAAREEFLEKGFMGTGLREIAARADISTSNIYNYFDNKEDLFQALLRPLIHKIQQVFQSAEVAGLLHDKNGWDITLFRGQVSVLLQFIEENREDLLLLVKCSQGSSLFDYKQRLIDRYSYSLFEKVNFILRQIHPAKKEVSEDFIRSISAFYFQTLEDLVLRPLDQDKKEEFINEISSFIYFGWRSIFKNQS